MCTNYYGFQQLWVLVVACIVFPCPGYIHPMRHTCVYACVRVCNAYKHACVQCMSVHDVDMCVCVCVCVCIISTYEYTDVGAVRTNNG